MQSMCTHQSVLKHRQDAHLLVYEGAQRQMPHAPCSTTGTCIYLLTPRIASWSAADAKVACTGVRSMKWPAYLVRCSRGYVLALRTAPRSGALSLSRPSPLHHPSHTLNSDFSILHHRPISDLRCNPQAHFSHVELICNQPLTSSMSSTPTPWAL